ncbi:MAG TPA: hypothetical protein VFX20_19970 [Steroidobacteraceae bacterium]|nr:hypothetical protein [Steroidobacteraceae bacterium]
MPLLTWEDTNAAADVLPGRAPDVMPHPDSAAPDVLDTVAAAFRQSNILASVVSKYENGGYTSYPAIPGYDPYENNGAPILGYEQYADRFSKSNSPAETQSIKNQIDQENSDKQTLARAGTPGYLASLAAGAVDPIFLTAQFLPGIGEAVDVSRLARIGMAVATNVAVGEAQAGALAANQQTGDYSAGALPRIATNALLAGVLGSIAPKIPTTELDAVRPQVEASLRPVVPTESTAGAAQVAGTTLEDESIAKGGQTLAATVGKVSPLARIFSKGSLESRQLAQAIADPGFLLQKNLNGVATPTSVEMRVNQKTNWRNFQITKALDSEFADYKTQGGEMSHGEFSAAVADAMRAGDQSDIPAVRKVAQFIRPMFAADRAALAELGEMAPGEDVIGAPSYFPRVYNAQKILNNQTDFERLLTDWFAAHPKLDENGLPIEREPAEIQASVRETMNRIMGTVRNTAEFARSGGVKALHERSLDVPDEVLKPYLSHDLEGVMRAYNRTVTPAIEMRRAFGSVDLEPELQSIKDAYAVSINRAADDAGKAALTGQMNSDLSDLQLLRDRVMNRVGPRNDQSGFFVRAANVLRSWNYVRMLGGQTLSALPDLGRLVTRYGLANTGHRLATFLASSHARSLTLADARRMGTAVDNVLHTRVSSLDGIGEDEMAAPLHNLTARFTKLSGIAHWDTTIRALSSQLEQDALYRLINKSTASSLERAKLASHGIGDAELPAIREQWAKYGSSEGGLNRARTELWDNKDAAAAVEHAVQRAASNSAFYVGAGDLPRFASSDIGRLMLQFKAFSLSSVNRLLLPTAQGLAHRDLAAVNGVATLLALGGLSYYLKELAAGRKPDLSADSLIPNAVQRSGLLSYLPDLYDPLAGTLHLPRFAKFQDLNPLETAGGPSLGTAATVLDVIRRLTKGNIAQADLHKLRQLLPYQNLFYFTRLVNMAEGVAGNALGAKGAPDKSAADYFNPSEDEQPKYKTDKQHLFGAEAIPNAF